MLTNPTLLNKVDLRKYDNSLSTAIADTDLVGKTLVVTNPVTCGNITIPDTIALEILNGGSISVNAGATLSVNGPYDSCVETPFLGSGNVVINSPVKNNNHDNLTGTSIHGLGTASTADVTTSTTDTTDGRLLKVGDFGLGVSAAPIVLSDLQSISTPCGFYKVDTSTLNKPPGITNGGCYVSRWAHNALSILLIDVTTEKVYRGRYNGVGWYWSKLFHEGNILGTVSQASGVPTGAIIERGSNANGEYVKFADGTLICTANRWIVGLWKPDITLGRSWDYPASFSNGSDVVIIPEYISTNSGTVGNGIAYLLGSLSNSSGTIYVKNNTGSDIGSNLTEKMVAIGRWY